MKLFGAVLPLVLFASANAATSAATTSTKVCVMDSAGRMIAGADFDGAPTKTYFSPGSYKVEPTSSPTPNPPQNSMRRLAVADDSGGAGQASETTPTHVVDCPDRWISAEYAFESEQWGAYYDVLQGEPTRDHSVQSYHFSSDLVHTEVCADENGEASVTNPSYCSMDRSVTICYPNCQSDEVQYMALFGVAQQFAIGAEHKASTVTYEVGTTPSLKMKGCITEVSEPYDGVSGTVNGGDALFDMTNDGAACPTERTSVSGDYKIASFAFAVVVSEDVERVVNDSWHRMAWRLEASAEYIQSGISFKYKLAGMPWKRHSVFGPDPEAATTQLEGFAVCDENEKNCVKLLLDREYNTGDFVFDRSTGQVSSGGDKQTHHQGVEGETPMRTWLDDSKILTDGEVMIYFDIPAPNLGSYFLYDPTFSSSDDFSSEEEEEEADEGTTTEGEKPEGPEEEVPQEPEEPEDEGDAPVDEDTPTGAASAAQVPSLLLTAAAVVAVASAR